MEAQQKLVAPKSHYPIVFVSWKVKLQEKVERDQPIGIYEFTETVKTKDEETGVETTQQLRRKELLRTFYAGTFTKAIARPGQEIIDPLFELGIVTEPCGHAVQLAGLCALCGKDLTVGDYLGSDTTRATINMTHDAKGVTVSLEEAKRIDKDTTQRLRKERKLSLILDLDQTVIHATGDPTIGEWMADAHNPNYPALHDVHSFILPDSPIVYYIKLRPGTREFLTEMHKHYEMHIYTMGTRQYALAVAKILDPTGDYFKSRILSRDESGSFSIKSIQRLFPCDQSMVAVVDDRGDVWNWSPNLFKVKPYDFFVGIGDINEPIYAASRDPALTPPKALESIDDSSKASSDNIISQSNEDESDISDKNEILHIMHDIQVHSLEQQQQTRPLLHTQEVADEEAKIVSTSESKHEDGKLRRPVLADHDNVLEYVSRALRKVHQQFYDLTISKDEQDVRIIIPRLKSSILAGVHIVFSSVVPMGQPPETHPLWIQATSFGAICHHDLNDLVTHVVAAKKGTAKVNSAKKLKNVRIVKPDWLIETLTTWTRQNESFFLLDEEDEPPTDFLVSDAEDGLDLDDEIFARFGEDDWKDMDKEVEEAMLEDSDDNDDEQSEEGSQEEKDRPQEMPVAESTGSRDRDVSIEEVAGLADTSILSQKSAADSENWDDFAEELENELDSEASEQEAPAPQRSSLKRRGESPGGDSKKKFKVVLQTSDSFESIATNDADDDENQDYFTNLNSWTEDDK